MLILKIILFGLIFLTPKLSIAQTIVENKIDEFTNHKIVRSSWETLNISWKYTGYFRISQINETMYFDLKMGIAEGMSKGKIFSIGENQEIMFKIESGEIIKLKNLRHEVTCIGCGAIGHAGSGGYGLSVSFVLPKENAEKLKNNKVVKIRIYTTDGYVEDDTKEKHAEKIRIALKLFNS